MTSSKYEKIFLPTFTSEDKETFHWFFEETAKHATPNFSKEDWWKLWSRAQEGDPTSIRLFVGLFKEKVLPKLDPKFIELIENSDCDFWNEN